VYTVYLNHGIHAKFFNNFEIQLLQYCVRIINVSIYAGTSFQLLPTDFPGANKIFPLFRDSEGRDGIGKVPVPVPVSTIKYDSLVPYNWRTSTFASQFEFFLSIHKVVHYCF
jgi:hypothetical protein